MKLAGPVLLLVAGCSSNAVPVASEPSTPTHQAELAPVSAPAAPPPVQSLDHAAAPASAQDLVADHLAEAWCVMGGDTFAAPGSSKPDTLALASCNDVARSTLSSVDLGSIVGLSVPTNEESRWLHLAKSNQTILLATAWSSGVGGFSHEIEATPLVVADVYGDAEPEIWTFVTTGWNDTDMGVCHRQGMRKERLVLCTTSGGVACFELPLVDFVYEETYSEVGGDSSCPTPKRKATGYGLEVAIARDKVTLKATGKEAFRWTHPTRAPFNKTVEMADLFAKAPAKLR